MALDDLLISTGVDQLIRLVKEKGRVEIGAAAKELKQPMRTIEDWTHVLEEEGLVSIEYKLTKIFLVWHGPTSEYVAEKAEKLGAKAGEARQEIDILLKKVQQGGEELSGMQQEISRLESSPAMSPADVENLKGELSALEKKYSSSLSGASEKFQKLKKSVLALQPKLEAGASAGKGGTAISEELAGELSVLGNFEKTLQSQINENESSFSALEGKLEELRRKIESGKSDEKLRELRASVQELFGMKEELSSALEAVSEEQKTIGEKLAAAEAKLAEYGEKEDSLSGAKRKLDELRRMQQDAKKQKDAIGEQLQDSLALVKKETARLEEILGKQSQQEKRMDALKEDYVDISEEVSKANEELAAKRKEVSAKIALQLEALSKGAIADPEEVQKVSFLLRELKREQTLLEEKVRMLGKESELLRLESESVASSAKSGGTGRGAQAQVQVQKAQNEQESLAFVEKVKLSEEEEGEFERKREELRSLIHKMWEDSKGGRGG